MATHASAEKASRQANKRAKNNLAIRSEFKTSIKKLNVLITNMKKSDKEYVQSKVMPALNEVQKLLMRAASKNIIHKNTASRRISRLNLSLQRAAKA